MIRRLLMVPALMAAVLGTLIGAVIPASAGVVYRASAARAVPLPVLYNLGGGSGAEWNLPQRRPAIFTWRLMGARFSGTSRTI